jgi:hypothetical protein
MFQAARYYSRGYDFISKRRDDILLLAFASVEVDEGEQFRPLRV